MGMMGPGHPMMTRAGMGRGGIPAGWHDDYEDGDMGDDDDEEYGDHDHEMDLGTRSAAAAAGAGAGAGQGDGDGVSRGGSRGQGHDRNPRGGGRNAGNLDEHIPSRSIHPTFPLAFCDLYTQHTHLLDLFTNTY